MDERLRDGLRVWRKITSHEARRRQGQYIGKILRESDPDALRVEIAAYWRARERAQLDAERWRDRLLADDADHRMGPRPSRYRVAAPAHPAPPPAPSTRPDPTTGM